MFDRVVSRFRLRSRPSTHSASGFGSHRKTQLQRYGFGMADSLAHGAGPECHTGMPPPFGLVIVHDDLHCIRPGKLFGDLHNIVFAHASLEP